MRSVSRYIECEYSAKFDKPYEGKLYGAKVLAPTQDNFFDCGIYLLQYVESFFKVSSGQLLTIQPDR